MAKEKKTTSNNIPKIEISSPSMSTDRLKSEDGNKLSPFSSKFINVPLEPATSPSVPRWMRRNSQQSISTTELQLNNFQPNYSSIKSIQISSVQQGNNDTRGSKLNLFKGLLLAALSSVFFCLSSVIVKYVKELNPAQLANFRFISIFIFTMPAVSWKRQFPFGPKNMYHFLIFRGILGATNLFLRFVAFRYLPLADASIIVFSVPIFVAIFARIFLKEPCGIFQGITIALTLLGVFLITKMPLVISKGISYSNEQIWGILAAVTSTIFGAGVYIILRKLKSLHYSVIMFNFGWVAVIETLIITSLFGFKLPHCGLNQGLLVLLGIFSFCGQSLMTMSLQSENAAPVAVVRAAVDIFFAFFWQVLFFHEIPDGYTISGAILVSCCVFMTSIRKWILSLPEDSAVRTKLSFVTL